MRRGPWRAARPWLLASAATLAALAAGRPALAVSCSPAVPTAGGIVTCVNNGITDPGITYAGVPDMTLRLDGTANGLIELSDIVMLIPNSAATPSLIETLGPVSIVTLGSDSYGLITDGRTVGATVGITVGSGTTITTSGAASHGVYAVTNGSGAAIVTLTGGSIQTGFDFARGAVAETVDGIAMVTQTGGSIATSGANAHGAYAVSSTGAATITVSGLITTGGDNAHGAFAELGASSAATALVTMTGGSVTTGVDALGVPTLAGADASGLFARTLGTGLASVVVTGGTIITGGDSSGGVLAGGAIAESAGGMATVSVTGSITTHGAGAVAAGASGATGATGATVTLIGAGITTAGQDAYGAYAALVGAGTAMITIDAASTILTNGFDAHGAYAEVASGTGSASVISAGSITTTGVGAAGLHAAVLGGPATIINTGSVATSGSGAPGIFAISGGAAAISSSGSITTTGGSAVGAFAISLATSSAVASITISGSILTGDGGTASGAYGAYATLILASSGLASVILAEGGSITTTGLGGVAAFADVLSGGDAAVTNAGSIATAGEMSHGAWARVNSGTGNARVENSGQVAVAGFQTAALYAAVELGATGTATVLNSGSATTTGDAAYPILAYAAGGDVVVTNTGSLAATGLQSHGIVVDAGGTATVTSGGGISATGPAASGIFIASAVGGYTLAVTGGTITGGSIGAILGTGAGISIGGDASGTIAIAAGATVQAASGWAIQDAGGAMRLTSSGSILGSISAGAGDDQVTLDAGSVTQGQVLLGAGADLAVLRAGADVAGVTLFDGEGGSDTLRLEGATVTGGAQFANWEALSLTQGARLTLNGDLVMGGADTLAGSVAIDATSTLAAPGDRTIRAFDAGSLVTVTNAGAIAIGSGMAAGNTLTIAGNYVGQGGSIALNTVLAGDGSASDRLVISGGRASGDTILRITNLGGAGAPTVQGIRVVETRNGATTDPGAFRLNTRVVGGAFEYQLFRGGSSSAQDWYLRSFLIPETPVTPDQPGTPEEPGTPTGPAIPLYRPEASLYAAVAGVARQMGLSTLGTLQSRRSGEGEIPDVGGTLGKEGAAPGHAAWARVIGERSRSRWDGTVDARATGNLIGLQAGFDILQTQPYAGGHRDILGVYVAYTDFNAPSVSGFAHGQRNLRVGRLLVSGPAAGAYWTHFGPGGWYVDAAVQANWFDVSAWSDFGAGLSTNGTGYAASLEAGYPIRIAAGWQLEPSAQLVWQSVSVDHSQDQDASQVLSPVDWDAGDAVTGRIGARLQYTGRDDRTLWQPYAKVNLWHAFSGNDRVSFGGGTPIESRFGETALEVGTGVTARVNDATSFYAHADYRWSLAGDSRQTAVQGSIGIRVTW